MSETLPGEPSGAVAATAMFVEVLFVGIGFVSALTLAAVAAADSHDATKMVHATASTPFTAAALAAAYALGILIDRAADSALGIVRRRLRTSSFATEATYAQARLALAATPALAARAEYARSRMRVCRGWIINAALLTLAGDAAIARHHAHQRPLLLGLITGFGILTTVGFYTAWQSITVTSYRKLATQTAVHAFAVPAPTSSLHHGTGN